MGVSPSVEYRLGELSQGLSDIRDQLKRHEKMISTLSSDVHKLNVWRLKVIGSATFVTTIVQIIVQYAFNK